MTATEDAYTAARHEIARARAAGETKLDFDREDFRALDRLPPEIAEFAELTHLDLDKTAVQDLSPIAGLTFLQVLWLNQTAVRDLTPVARLTALQGLSLDQTAVPDLTPLIGLTALRELWLNRTAVHDLAPLAGLTGLQGLRLNQTRVHDLTSLIGLTALQELWFAQTAVQDLRPIRDLPQLGDGTFDGLQFRGTPAVARDAELRRLSEIEDVFERTRETLAYLKTLPPWPEPLPWQVAGEARNSASGEAPAVQAAQAQLQALMRHPMVTRVTAAQFADQIEQALKGLPSENGNRLAEPFQTMLEFAEVVRKLAPEGHAAPETLGKAELRRRIHELEELVERLTGQLATAEDARRAAEDLLKANGFGASYRKSLGMAAGGATVALIGVGVPTAAIYFLGEAHPLVRAFLTALGRLPG